MLELIASLASVDQSVFLFINKSLANPVTDFLMPLITLDLHLKILYGSILAIILWKGDKRLRMSVMFSLIVVALSDQACSTFLKPMIGRLRPCWDLDVNLLVGCGTGFSMPSSHASNLFGQAYFYRAVAPSSVKYLIPLAIVVALSRVFVGVHYPADIIAGAALGTLIGFGVGLVFNRFFPSKKIRQINTETGQSDKS